MIYEIEYEEEIKPLIYKMKRKRFGWKENADYFFNEISHMNGYKNIRKIYI